MDAFIREWINVQFIYHQFSIKQIHIFPAKFIFLFFQRVFKLLLNYEFGENAACCLVYKWYMGYSLF
jgi:hypothetical protein